MRLLAHSTILLACCVAAQAQSPERDRTNVVLIYIDNVGWGDLASYGNPAVRTPNMDRLAAQGVRLTDFYIPSSSCSPSRGALLTGRYPDRNGLTHQLSVQENWSGIGLPHSERLLPEIMREHGYATAAFGKWNIGFAEGSRPTDRGFDEFIGCISGNCDYYTHVYNGRLDMHVGTEPTRIEGYSTDIFADAAVGFIRRSADRPFFLFVPFNAAHYPNRKNKAAGQLFPLAGSRRVLRDLWVLARHQRGRGGLPRRDDRAGRGSGQGLAATRHQRAVGPDIGHAGI